jgi:hypothetical protein
MKLQFSPTQTARQSLETIPVPVGRKCEFSDLCGTMRAKGESNKGDWLRRRRTNNTEHAHEEQSAIGNQEFRCLSPLFGVQIRED